MPSSPILPSPAIATSSSSRSPAAAGAGAMMSLPRSWFSEGIASATVEMPRVHTRPVAKKIKRDSDDSAPVKHGEGGDGSASAAPPPARWRTPEFVLYALVVVWALYKMTLQGMALSQESHRMYEGYKHKLEPGWLPGRRIDNSDSQYRKFRQGFPSLIALAVGYLAVAKTVAKIYGPRSRLPFLVASSAVITTALHGMSAVKILILLTLSFGVGRLSAGKRWGVLAVWVFNVGLLFSNEIYDGYRFRYLHSSLAPLDAGNLRGLLPRWQIGFNISILRLLSFSLDYQWASSTSAPRAPAKENGMETEGFISTDSPATPDEKVRVKTSRPLEEYTLAAYFAYVLYPPLYIAGPIITFNNFMAQIKTPPRIRRATLGGYAVRFLVCYLTMEWILQNIYAVAIKDAHAWSGDTPFELSMIGYWNLIIVWLKLLIPWRFFRLWALADGCDPPENMIRCMANNYSTFGFWRSWHRSYNLWVVRYIYVPLGGSGNVLGSTLLVFTFVALWHDLSFRLLMWGWSVSFFVVPELVAGMLLPETTYGKRWWYRHLAAIGGAMNIMTMMSANLIGFAIGVEGIKLMWSELLGSWSGLRLLITASLVFFSATQLMMEYRAEELRRGIVRRC